MWEEMTVRCTWMRTGICSIKRQSFYIPLPHLFNQKRMDSIKGPRNARPLARNNVCLLPVLLATAATVTAGLGSVFNQIKGTFSLLFSSIHGPAAAPNPSSLDWFPLTMTFLHMQPSHDGAVGSNWLSADSFGFLAFTSCISCRSCGFGARVHDGVQFHSPMWVTFKTWFCCYVGVIPTLMFWKIYSCF